MDECWKTSLVLGYYLTTEWVAIFRESGLRDDASMANLQEA